MYKISNYGKMTLIQIEFEEYMSKTKVIEIGSEAYFESFPLLVLFNNTAPDGLRDVCIIHEVVGDYEDIPLQPGGEVVFDGIPYKIIKVGSLANQNLKELGHVSMYFEAETELLPGAILLSPSEVPQLKGDSTIEFKQP